MNVFFRSDLTRKTIAAVLCLMTAVSLLLCAPSAKLSVRADGEDIWGGVTTYDDLSIDRGKSQDVSCSVFTNADSYVLYWYSSNTNIANVQAQSFSNNATIYAMNEGSCRITVTLRAGGMTLDSDSFTVTVRSGRTSVSGVGLNTTSFAISAGQSYQLQGYVYPSNANNKGILWESSDTTVATVDANGLVVGLSDGHSTITAKSAENPSIHESCGVDVSGQLIKVSGITLNKNTLTLAGGYSYQLLYYIYPSNATNRKVVWSTSDEWVAPVYQDGTVSGYRQGSAIVTARTDDGGYTATCIVNVTSDASFTPSPSVPTPAPAPAPAPTPSTTTSTHDAVFIYNTCVAILNAPAGGTASVSCAQPMAYDTNVANALKARPDVTLVATFPFNGHTFNLILPKGYNLSAKLDKTGYVDFLVLCNYQNVPGDVQVVMIK